MSAPDIKTFDDDGLYPIELEIERAIAGAVAGDMPPEQIAKAIFAGFSKVPLTIPEQVADELQAYADEAHRQKIRFLQIEHD